MKKVLYILFILIGLAASVYIGLLIRWNIQRESDSPSMGVPVSSEIVLTQNTEATGGLIDITVDGEEIVIQTDTGQSSEYLASHIASIINSHPELKRRGVQAQANQTRIKITSSTAYICTESETNLGIPTPLEPLQCEWNSRNKTIHFTWSAGGQYDSIEILDAANNRFNNFLIKGNATRYTHKAQKQTDDLFGGINTFGVRGTIGANSCKATCEIHI